MPFRYVERKSPRWNISIVAWLKAPSSTSKSGARPRARKKLASTAATVSAASERVCIRRGIVSFADERPLPAAGAFHAEPGLSAGMADARRSRRVLPARASLPDGRPGLQPRLGARARRGRPLPDQRLRHDLRRDHRLEPGEDRLRRQDRPG